MKCITFNEPLGPTESLLSESTIAVPIVCPAIYPLFAMSMVWLVAHACMDYGLSDKCPESVDKLSSLLGVVGLISSLDFDSETRSRCRAVAIFTTLVCDFPLCRHIVSDVVINLCVPNFHDYLQCDVTIRWVALSTWQ